jgi:ABC-type multidrug transport system ATPase subunit
MIKKVGLIGAFLPDAELRILDEPFAGGIDPYAMEFLFELFRSRAARGETIVFSTQVLLNRPRRPRTEFCCSKKVE